MTLHWNYTQQIVDLNIPNYISNVLRSFQHTSSKPTYTLFTISFSHKTFQYKIAAQKDHSPTLNQQETKRIRQITRCLLYYTHALDNTIVVALNIIDQT